MGIEQLNQLGEIRQRPRQTVDLVDDDDVNLPGADIIQQLLKVGTVGRPTGVSPIVIAGPDQGPAGMGLAFDIGGGSIVLRIQRVELLVEPVLGGDPCIDRAADRSDGRSLHDRASIVDRSSLSRRPKKRGPFHLVPVMAKATLERLSSVWPFQAKPSAITITRCDCRSHSRTRTVPGVSSVRFWSKLASRADIAGPPSFVTVRSSTCLVACSRSPKRSAWIR